MITPTSGWLVATHGDASVRLQRWRHAHTTDRDARHRAPRDAGRDGRRLLPRARRRGVRGRRLRHARRGDDGVRASSTTRWPACASSPTSRSVSTCSPRCPSACSTTRTRSSSGGASLFVAGLGVPRDVIKILHDGNVLVASMCGKVRHAIAAVEAGCDFVIAQGTEAGGHTGTVATMPLVPQIVDAVGDRVPVVAAGGIFDGRGLAAALSARRRRRVARHALHRDARGAHGAPATRTRCCARPRTTR